MMRRKPLTPSSSSAINSNSNCHSDGKTLTNSASSGPSSDGGQEVKSGNGTAKTGLVVSQKGQRQVHVHGHAGMPSPDLDLLGDEEENPDLDRPDSAGMESNNRDESNDDGDAKGQDGDMSILDGSRSSSTTTTTTTTTTKAPSTTTKTTRFGKVMTPTKTRIGNGVSPKPSIVSKEDTEEEDGWGW